MLDAAPTKETSSQNVSLTPEARLLFEMPGLEGDLTAHNNRYAIHRSMVAVQEALTRNAFDPEFVPYPSQRLDFTQASPSQIANFTAECLITDMKRNHLTDELDLVEQGTNFYRQLAGETGNLNQAEDLLMEFRNGLQGFAAKGQPQPDVNKLMQEIATQTVNNVHGDENLVFPLKSYFLTMFDLMRRGPWWQRIIGPV